jgi:hypothetical protein
MAVAVVMAGLGVGREFSLMLGRKQEISLMVAFPGFPDFPHKRAEGAKNCGPSLHERTG